MRHRLVPWLIAIFALAMSPTRSLALDAIPTVVTIDLSASGAFTYLVNGQPQLFVGMGYNPMYGRVPFAQRGQNYRRDFKLLCQAGVNTITGWDADKGFDQDRFDELTLDEANRFGIGVVMPFYLPVEGDYHDQRLVDQIWDSAGKKIAKFKSHPALRMWGVGNEVLVNMPPDMYPAFLSFYLRLADLFHAFDPNHPVIYRDAEDPSVPLLAQALNDSGDPRPWLLYGMNVYNKDPAELLARWPSYGLDRPLVVSEFGTQGVTPDMRAQGYATMWRSIRAFPQFVLGGAPYAWTVAGPEPTDRIWGLMDVNSRPVDGTFHNLEQLWRAESKANHANCEI